MVVRPFFCSSFSWLENYPDLSETTMQPNYSLLSCAMVVSTPDNHLQPLVGVLRDRVPSTAAEWSGFGRL